MTASDIRRSAEELKDGDQPFAHCPSLFALSVDMQDPFFSFPQSHHPLLYWLTKSLEMRE